MTVVAEPYREEKISEMNLIALRKYACPKINSQRDWFLKCVECSGLKGCSAGKRAIEILESQTKPEKSQIDKFNERLEKTKMKEQEKKEKLSMDARLTEAEKHKDPIGWLVSQGYYSKRKYASNKLSAWRKKKQDPNYKADPENWQNKGPVTIRMKAKNNIRNLLEGHKDADDLLMRVLRDSKPERKGNSIGVKCYHWAKLEDYQDIPGIKDFMEIGRILTSNEYGSCLAKDILKKMEERLMAEKNSEQPVNAEDDLISVEDFLKTETPAMAEPSGTDIPAVVESSEEIPDTDMAKEFLKKIKMLTNRKMELQSEITKINKQLMTLKEAAQLFDIQGI